MDPSLWSSAALAVTPTEAVHLRLSVGPYTFDALAAGPSDGELVLLLHGFPQTSYAYRHLLESLGRQGFRAVAFDQRGYSPDARPEAVADYQISHLVSDAIGVADALGRPTFHLVGHDWGGAVAWITAARFPHRVTSLTVLSTPHPRAFGSSLRSPSSEQSERSAYMKDFAAADAEARFLADDAAHLRGLYGTAVPIRDVQFYVETFRRPGTLTGALNWYRASGLGRATPAPAASPPTDLTIHVPTLYIYGADDGAFSPETAGASGSYVTGPYVFDQLEGVGHWLLEEAPGKVEEALFAHLTRATEVTTLRLATSLPSRGRLGGLSVAADGTLYVANFGASVWRISTSGEVVRVIDGLQGSSGNALDPGGRLLQASFLDGRIVRLSELGSAETLVAEGAGLEGPVGLAAADDGTIFVCNCRGNSIARVEAEGTLSTLARSELFRCPNGIAFGPGGNLFVTNFEDGRVLEIGRDDGEVSLFATVPEGQNAHLAFFDDVFYVTKVASNRIYRVQRDGSTALFAGSGERGLTDGPRLSASFATPNAIAASADGAFLFVNNLEGPWRGEVETTLRLRKIRIERDR